MGRIPVAYLGIALLAVALVAAGGYLASRPTEPVPTTVAPAATTASTPTLSATAPPTVGLRRGICITISDKAGTTGVSNRQVDCDATDEPSFLVVDERKVGDCPTPYQEYTVISGAVTTYYCLMPNLRTNQCYREAAKPRRGLAPVDCRDRAAEIKVTQVLTRNDKAGCASAQKVLNYSLPPETTFCVSPL